MLLVAVQQLGQRCLSSRTLAASTALGAPAPCGCPPDVHLHPEVPLLAFFVWCISGSRALSAFVELGAPMMVVSTIVPVPGFSPALAVAHPTVANSF